MHGLFGSDRWLARHEKSPTLLRLARGCCKVRIFSASNLYMVVARPLDALPGVNDGFVSDPSLISRRFVRGNMVIRNVQWMGWLFLIVILGFEGRTRGHNILI